MSLGKVAWVETGSGVCTWGLFATFIGHRLCCELWVLESHSCLVTALSGQGTGSASSLTEIIAAWANRESH